MKIISNSRKERFQEEAAGAGGKGEKTERRADEAAARSEQRDLERGLAKINRELASWEEATRTRLVDKDQSVEKTMMNDVCQNWEERAEWWRRCWRRRRKRAEEANKQETQRLKEETFNLQDQNVRRKRKSSCVPYLRSETPPSIHLLNPVLKSTNWIKLILMFCLCELKTLSANYLPCLVSCNYINLFHPLFWFIHRCPAFRLNTTVVNVIASHCKFNRNLTKGKHRAHFQLHNSMCSGWPEVGETAKIVILNAFTHHKTDSSCVILVQNCFAGIEGI